MLLLLALSIGFVGMVWEDMHSEWWCSGRAYNNGRRHWHYCFSAVPYTGGAIALRFRYATLSLDPVAGLAGVGFADGTLAYAARSKAAWRCPVLSQAT